MAETEEQCVSDGFGSEVHATRIVTRLVMLTRFWHNGICLFGSMIVEVPMSMLVPAAGSRFGGRMDALRLQLRMGVMPATAKDAVNQHRQQRH